MLSNEDIVYRIRYYLDKQHISAYKLCKKAGVPISTVSNLFSRGNSPSVYTLQKLVKGLEISMGEFFGEVEESRLSELSPREETLVYQYRRVSNRDKETVVQMLNVMEKNKMSSKV